MKAVLFIEGPSGLKMVASSQGLNFKSDSLSALEPSDPGPHVHAKISCLALALVLHFCEEQIQYRRSERRHFEFVFPLSVLRHLQLELRARIALVILFQ